MVSLFLVNDPEEAFGTMKCVTLKVIIFHSANDDFSRSPPTRIYRIKYSTQKFFLFLSIFAA